MTMLKLFKDRSAGTVLVITCILCALVTALSDLCPEDIKRGCVNVAGVLNCILCIVFLIKLFDISV